MNRVISSELSAKLSAAAKKRWATRRKNKAMAAQINTQSNGHATPTTPDAMQRLEASKESYQQARSRLLADLRELTAALESGVCT